MEKAELDLIRQRSSEVEKGLYDSSTLKFLAHKVSVLLNEIERLTGGNGGHGRPWPEYEIKIAL